MQVCRNKLTLKSRKKESIYVGLDDAYDTGMLAIRNLTLKQLKSNIAFTKPWKINFHKR